MTGLRDGAKIATVAPHKGGDTKRLSPRMFLENQTAWSLEVNRKSFVKRATDKVKSAIYL